MAEHLKKLKHPQKDLFVIDGFDAIIKDDMPSMEHPFYSLSKKPDREIRRYEHNGKWIEFRPGIKGLPTIYDKDLIIYAISNLIASLDEGEEPPKEVEIDPYSFFVFSQRGTGGKDYEALVDSLERLDGARFRTNISMEGKMIDDWQGIIDRASLVTNTETGRPERLRITLSDMVINSIKKRDVLTLNRNYFRLKKPIERRIYEIARKHVGQQKSWEVKLETLQKKAGSRSTLSEFRRSIKSLIKHDYLPDYHFYYDEDTDKAFFYPKEAFTIAYKKPKSDSEEVLPPLATWAIERGKTAYPEIDVYELEQAWREVWKETGCKKLDNHNAAFIGWCKAQRSKAEEAGEI